MGCAASGPIVTVQLRTFNNNTVDITGSIRTTELYRHRSAGSRDVLKGSYSVKIYYNNCKKKYTNHLLAMDEQQAGRELVRFIDAYNKQVGDKKWFI